MNHQARLTAMRNNMKRHLVGKSYAEIHTELAMRADSHREQIISLGAAQQSDNQYNSTIQSATMGRIEHAAIRIGSKLERIDKTLTHGAYLIAALLVIRWTLHYFAR